MTNKEYADALHSIAEWFDAHSEVPPPSYPELSVTYSEDTKELAAAVAEALAPCRKEYADNIFTLERVFGGVRVKFVFWRNAVCTRRVVATEQVAERIVPAYTREIVEWDCHPLLTPEE